MPLPVELLVGCRRATALQPNSDPWDLCDLINLLVSTQQPNSNCTMDITHIQVDWRNTPMAHIIKADLPGLTKDDVKIQAGEDERVLEISGEFPQKELHHDETYLYSERPFGSFLRRFKLPENAEIHEVKAKMDKGVLTLIIPKSPGREPRLRYLPVSG